MTCFICHGKIIVELKDMEALAKKEQAQVINYLPATKFKRALLIKMEWKDKGVHGSRCAARSGPMNAFRIRENL